MVFSINRDPLGIMLLLVVALALTLNGCISAFSIKLPAWTNTLVQQGDLDQILPNVFKGPSATRIDLSIGRKPMTPSVVVSSVRVRPLSAACRWYKILRSRAPMLHRSHAIANGRHQPKRSRH